MKNYWSSSKLADWIRGTNKPLVGTEEQWHDWEKAAKTKTFRYWLAEEGLDYLQDFIFWPVNRYKALLFYINNRWITKSHALNSKLKRGEWHDFDNRLLHSVFDELINFVEIELAWMSVVFSEENKKKYKTPWFRTFLKIRAWRNSEAGLEYLNWASQLKYDEDWMDKTDLKYGQPTPQALAAEEILKLYKWWKEERSKRPDPYDASGWTQHSESFRKKPKSEEDSVTLRNMLKNSHEIEQEQYNEDTAMLIRVIKIRNHIWT